MGNEDAGSKGDDDGCGVKAASSKRGKRRKVATAAEQSPTEMRYQFGDDYATALFVALCRSRGVWACRSTGVVLTDSVRVMALPAEHEALSQRQALMSADLADRLMSVTQKFIVEQGLPAELSPRRR
jgi:hypothetical protein